MSRTADVVIIGGGVTGMSLAFHLARRGAGRVVVLEKKFLAAGGTGYSVGVIRQLYHTFDRREVRSEHEPPGLHTVLPGRTAGPATHAVDDLVNFFWRSSGLVGGVDVNLDMVHRVPHGNISRYPDQLFGFSV